MSKIYRVVITIIVILSLLSINVFSANLSDDFVFTSYWWNEVLNNTVITMSYDGVNNIASQINSCSWNYTLSVNESGTIVNYPWSYAFMASRYSNIGNNKLNNYMNVSIPLNLYVKAGESLSFDFVVFYNFNISDYMENIKDIDIKATHIYANGSYYDSFNVDYEVIENSRISINNDTGATDKYFGSIVVYHINFTSTEDLLINRFLLRTYNQFIRVPTNMYYGVFNGDEVDSVVGSEKYIPSNELKELQNISSELLTLNNQLNTLTSQMTSIQEQLQSIYEKLGVESSTTNNYYQTITNASQEDKDKIEELQNQLATTEEQLKEVTEKLSLTEEIFPDEEVLENIQQNTISSITDYTSGAEVSSIMNIFFGNEFIMTLLVMSFGLATVSFILYGKKG